MSISSVAPMPKAIKIIALIALKKFIPERVAVFFGRFKVKDIVNG